MPCPRARAFSLLEMVVVVVMIGVVAAIAIPRMSSAAENSSIAALTANLTTVQNAIELYATEHLERGPATDPDGSTNTDGTVFAQRLLRLTDDLGTIGGGGIYGPYLRNWPRNPINQKSSVRIGGAAAGADTHGWRFDPSTRRFQSDHERSKGTGGVAVGGEGVSVEGGDLQPDLGP